METVQLEEKVYAALLADEILMDLLPNREQSIFHLQAPAGEYPREPCIVYTPISDVPVLAADNAEELHRVLMRIHIITEDGNYADIYKAIKRIMSELGFSRQQATPLADRGKKMLAVDFKIIIGG